MSRNFDVEQRPVLLASEHVPVAGAAARAQPVDREFDRVRDDELNEIGNPRLRDAHEARDRLARELAAFSRALVVLRVAEDDVEGDRVDACVLAADRRRELSQLDSEPPETQGSRRGINAADLSWFERGLTANIAANDWNRPLCAGRNYAQVLCDRLRLPL